MRYTLFRELVLAETNGQNIHAINGALGRVLSGIHNSRHFRNSDKEGSAGDAERCEASVAEALVFIQKETGVNAMSIEV